MISAHIDELYHPTRVKICAKLNEPDAKGYDWRALAYKLGFVKDIYIFEKEKNPTDFLLKSWSQQSKESTISALYEKLLEIERKDIAAELVDFLPSIKIDEATDDKVRGKRKKIEDEDIVITKTSKLDRVSTITSPVKNNSAQISINKPISLLYHIEKEKEKISTFDENSTDYLIMCGLYPSNPGSHSGNVKNELKQYSKSIEDYNKTINFNPSNPGYYSGGNAKKKIKTIFEKEKIVYNIFIENYDPQEKVVNGTVKLVDDSEYSVLVFRKRGDGKFLLKEDYLEGRNFSSSRNKRPSLLDLFKSKWKIENLICEEKDKLIAIAFSQPLKIVAEQIDKQKLNKSDGYIILPSLPREVDYKISEEIVINSK